MPRIVIIGTPPPRSIIVVGGVCIRGTNVVPNTNLVSAPVNTSPITVIESSESSAAEIVEKTGDAINKVLNTVLSGIAGKTVTAPEKLVETVNPVVVSEEIVAEKKLDELPPIDDKKDLVDYVTEIKGEDLPIETKCESIPTMEVKEPAPIDITTEDLSKDVIEVKPEDVVDEAPVVVLEDKREELLVIETKPKVERQPMTEAEKVERINQLGEEISGYKPTGDDITAIFSWPKADDEGVRNYLHISQTLGELRLACEAAGTRAFCGRDLARMIVKSLTSDRPISVEEMVVAIVKCDGKLADIKAMFDPTTKTAKIEPEVIETEVVETEAPTSQNADEVDPAGTSESDLLPQIAAEEPYVPTPEDSGKIERKNGNKDKIEVICPNCSSVTKIAEKKIGTERCKSCGIGIYEGG